MVVTSSPWKYRLVTRLVLYRRKVPDGRRLDVGSHQYELSHTLRPNITKLCICKNCDRIFFLDFFFVISISSWQKYLLFSLLIPLWIFFFIETARYSNGINFLRTFSFKYYFFRYHRTPTIDRNSSWRERVEQRKELYRAAMILHRKQKSFLEVRPLRPYPPFPPFELSGHIFYRNIYRI